ncbi:uncharacterized protein LOC144161767 [Haemaphysalis longicornis]
MATGSIPYGRNLSHRSHAHYAQNFLANPPRGYVPWWEATNQPTNNLLFIYNQNIQGQNPLPLQTAICTNFEIPRARCPGCVKTTTCGRIGRVPVFATRWFGTQHGWADIAGGRASKVPLAAAFPAILESSQRPDERILCRALGPHRSRWHPAGTSLEPDLDDKDEDLGAYRRRERASLVEQLSLHSERLDIPAAERKDQSRWHPGLHVAMIAAGCQRSTTRLDGYMRSDGHGLSRPLLAFSELNRGPWTIN